MKLKFKLATLATLFFSMTHSAVAMNIEPPRVTRYLNAPSDAFGFASRTAGSVHLQLEIDAKGNLKEIRTVKGRPDLIGAAVRTVRNWHFAPAKRDGVPVASQYEVVLNFDFSGQR